MPWFLRSLPRASGGEIGARRSDGFEQSGAHMDASGKPSSVEYCGTPTELTAKRALD